MSSRWNSGSVSPANRGSSIYTESSGTGRVKSSELLSLDLLVGRWWVGRGGTSPTAPKLSLRFDITTCPSWLFEFFVSIQGTGDGARLVVGEIGSQSEGCPPLRGKIFVNIG